MASSARWPPNILMMPRASSTYWLSVMAALPRFWLPSSQSSAAPCRARSRAGVPAAPRAQRPESLLTARKPHPHSLPTRGREADRGIRPAVGRLSLYLVAQALAGVILALRVVSRCIELGLGDDELLRRRAISQIGRERVESRAGHVGRQLNGGVGLAGRHGGKDVRHGVDGHHLDVGAGLETCILDGLDGANGHIVIMGIDRADVGAAILGLDEAFHHFLALGAGEV